MMGKKRFRAAGWGWIALCLAAAALLLPHRAAAEEDSRRSAVPLLPTPAYETAADGEIRQTILQLADKDATVRQHALDKLVKTRDGRLAAFVRSYFEGSLYLWNGQPVLGEQAASDAKGKRELLLDPLTLQPVLKDGVPAVVHLRELKEVDFPRTERKAVDDAQQALALWSDNYEKRISAIKPRANTKSSATSRPWRKSPRPIP